MRHLTREQFKAAVDHNELDDDYAVIKHCPANVKAVDDNPSSLEFVVSTGDVDAEKDILDPKGWSLERYLKNPVMLFGHDHTSPPIAKATKVWVSDGELKAIDEFMIGEEFGEPGAFAKSVLEMYKQGFMSAVSVGFLPDSDGYEYDAERKGFNFSKMEMLEHSAVPVPSNPNALMQARSAGIDLGPLKIYLVKMLDSGLFLPEEMEAMYNQAKTHTSVQVPEQIEADEPVEKGAPEAEDAPTQTVKFECPELLTALKSLTAKMEVIINEKDADPAPIEIKQNIIVPQAPTDEQKAEMRASIKEMAEAALIKTTGALPD